MYVFQTTLPVSLEKAMPRVIDFFKARRIWCFDGS
jgi:hypothetical protein